MIQFTHFIANFLDIPEPDLTEDTKLRDLLDDSLDFIEFLLALEEEYNADILDEDLPKLITIKDLHAYIFAEEESKDKDKEKTSS